MRIYRIYELLQILGVSISINYMNKIREDIENSNAVHERISISE